MLRAREYLSLAKWILHWLSSVAGHCSAQQKRCLSTLPAAWAEEGDAGSCSDSESLTALSIAWCPPAPWEVAFTTITSSSSWLKDLKRNRQMSMSSVFHWDGEIITRTVILGVSEISFATPFTQGSSHSCPSLQCAGAAPLEGETQVFPCVPVTLQLARYTSQ